MIDLLSPIIVGKIFYVHFRENAGVGLKQEKKRLRSMRSIRDPLSNCIGSNATFCILFGMMGESEYE